MTNDTDGRGAGGAGAGTTAGDNQGSVVPVVHLEEAAIPSSRDPLRPVLDSVTWQVRPGDYWAIAGLARSGKTNLLLAAAGALRPTRGKCRLFGQEIGAGYEEEQLAERLKIGVVFDGGQLLHHLTLAENVALPLDYHAADAPAAEAARQRLEALIEFTKLRRWATSHPADVNRNWQQRFGLARALALKPRVLLMDNPLSGLDPRDLSWWLETVDALAAGHPIVGGTPLTVVVTGDDFRLWRDRARQFALLSDGAFIQVGGRDQIEQHPEPLLREMLPEKRPAS
jgi:ABC-type transporter Mla maintaining outer membrane lipid asymmetry ATPase subunit MlaF